MFMVIDPLKVSVRGDGLGLIKANQSTSFVITAPAADIPDLDVVITGMMLLCYHHRYTVITGVMIIQVRCRHRYIIITGMMLYRHVLITGILSSQVYCRHRYNVITGMLLSQVYFITGMMLLQVCYYQRMLSFLRACTTLRRYTIAHGFNVTDAVFEFHAGV